jgi:hypothetical protein
LYRALREAGRSGRLIIQPEELWESRASTLFCTQFLHHLKYYVTAQELSFGSFGGGFIEFY